MKRALALLLVFASSSCVAKTYRLHSIEAFFPASPVYKENEGTSGFQAIVGNDIYTLAETRGALPFTSKIFDGWAIRVISSMQRSDPRLRFDDTRPEVMKFGNSRSMDERIFISSGSNSLGRQALLPFVQVAYGRVDSSCTSFYQAGVICGGSDSESLRRACVVKLKRFVESFNTFCPAR
jgi:hypothetical protein